MLAFLGKDLALQIFSRTASDKDLPGHTSVASIHASNFSVEADSIMIKVDPALTVHDHSRLDYVTARTGCFNLFWGNSFACCIILCWPMLVSRNVEDGSTCLTARVNVCYHKFKLLQWCALTLICALCSSLGVGHGFYDQHYLQLCWPPTVFQGPFFPASDGFLIAPCFSFWLLPKEKTDNEQCLMHLLALDGL